jgi:hypothetical protein
MKFNPPFPLLSKIKRLNAIICITIVSLFSLFIEIGFAHDLQIVVNPENPISIISKKELTQIYLRKKNFSNDGLALVPMDLRSNKMDFYESVLNKPFPLVKRYWTRAIFSGKGTPPKEFRDVDSLLKYLIDMPGGLAYVPEGSNLKNLKVLKIVP